MNGPVPVFQVLVTRMSDGNLEFKATSLDLVQIYGLLEVAKDVARGKVAEANSSGLLLPRRVV